MSDQKGVKPGFASAHRARITEVALMMGPLRGRGNSHAVDEAYFHQAVSLADDIWIGRFPLAQRVIAACQALGENWDVPHEWSTYAFWRTNAPYSKDRVIRFDADRRLSTTIQLSRLVRPTSIGYSRAARILEWDDQPIQIIPGRHEGRGAVAFVADERENWIRDQDVPTIRALVAVFEPDLLPNRVKRAMMYHEYAHGLRELDVRWPLLVSAAESLVHTDERKKVFGPGGMRVTDQFVRRLERLAAIIPAIGWTAGFLEEAYEHRSGFAHGRGRGAVSEAESLAMYSGLESGLRIALRAAMQESGVAKMFASDESIRDNLNPT